MLAFAAAARLAPAYQYGSYDGSYRIASALRHLDPYGSGDGYCDEGAEDSDVETDGDELGEESGSSSNGSSSGSVGGGRGEVGEDSEGGYSVRGDGGGGRAARRRGGGSGGGGLTAEELLLFSTGKIEHCMPVCSVP